MPVLIWYGTFQVEDCIYTANTALSLLLEVMLIENVVFQFIGGQHA